MTRKELDAFLNGDRTVFRIPERRGDDDGFFSIELGKGGLPRRLQALPEDAALTIGKHLESGTDESFDKYHVIITYTQWKEDLEVCEVEFLKQYSSSICQYVIDLDSDIQGTHFLDLPRSPYFVYAYVYSDGKEAKYCSYEEVMDNLSFYESTSKL